MSTYCNHRLQKTATILTSGKLWIHSRSRGHVGSNFTPWMAEYLNRWGASTSFLSSRIILNIQRASISFKTISEALTLNLAITWASLEDYQKWTPRTYSSYIYNSCNDFQPTTINHCLGGTIYPDIITVNRCKSAYNPLFIFHYAIMSGFVVIFGTHTEQKMFFSVIWIIKLSFVLVERALLNPSLYCPVIVAHIMCTLMAIQYNANHSTSFEDDNR